MDTRTADFCVHNDIEVVCQCVDKRRVSSCFIRSDSLHIQTLLDHVGFARFNGSLHHLLLIQVLKFYHIIRA